MDNVLNILKIIMAVLNIIFGIIVIWQPQTIARASHFELIGLRGVAELRVAFGGIFIGLGLGALILNDETAYQLFGFGYLGAIIVRIASLFIEDRQTLLDNSYIGIGAFELAAAIIFLI